MKLFLFAVLGTLTAIALFTFVGTALAEDGSTQTAVDLHELDAKDLYKQECKVCHGPDSEFGEYSPMELIGEQWEEFYDGIFEETHAEVKTLDENDGDKSVFQLFDADLIKKLRKFCVDHAADSEQPMTCG